MRSQRPVNVQRLVTPGRNNFAVILFGRVKRRGDVAVHTANDRKCSPGMLPLQIVPRYMPPQHTVCTNIGVKHHRKHRRVRRTVNHGDKVDCTKRGKHACHCFVVGHEMFRQIHHTHLVRSQCPAHPARRLDASVGGP
jgi:hypothetical protein